MIQKKNPACFSVRVSSFSASSAGSAGASAGAAASAPAAAAAAAAASPSPSPSEKRSFMNFPNFLPNFNIPSSDLSTQSTDLFGHVSPFSYMNLPTPPPALNTTAPNITNNVLKAKYIIKVFWSTEDVEISH